MARRAAARYGTSPGSVPAPAMPSGGSGSSAGRTRTRPGRTSRRRTAASGRAPLREMQPGPAVKALGPVEGHRRRCPARCRNGNRAGGRSRGCGRGGCDRNRCDAATRGAGRAGCQRAVASSLSRFILGRLTRHQVGAAEAGAAGDQNTIGHLILLSVAGGEKGSSFWVRPGRSERSRTGGRKKLNAKTQRRRCAEKSQPSTGPGEISLATTSSLICRTVATAS